MPTHYIPTPCVDNVPQVVVVFCFEFLPPFGLAVADFYFVRSHCYNNIAHNAPFVKGQSAVFTYAPIFGKGGRGGSPKDLNKSGFGSAGFSS